jgi:ribosome recycling factor
MTTEEQREDRVRKARARLEAARLRVRACSQDQNATAHMRQASHPIYDGQREICAGKAALIGSLADQTRAQADLIEAEAGL